MKNENDNTFELISKKWRKKFDTIKEYEVVEEEIERDFKTFIPSTIPYSEYELAERLKNKLLKRYEGMSLEDVIKGKEIETENGTCYKIEHEDEINLNTINPDRARVKILMDLKLIYGIGEITERFLKNEGYESIKDLKGHPRFGAEASRFLKLLDECDTCRIIDWITRWLPKSHPLVLCTSSFQRKENFVIIDIETLGLFTRPIILIGVALIIGNNILTTQYFLRDIEEEPAALSAFLSHIDINSVFVTFNGKAFDLPYIKERLAYYGIYDDLNKPHFDILHFSRRAWKEGIPDCRLTTLERYLFGVDRKDDIPSAMVPEFYETYLRSGNPGPLLPIVEHNKQDLVALVNIFSRLHEEWG